MYKLLDVVLLKDGREGTILEEYEKGKMYMVEVSGEDGKTIDTPMIPEEDIEKIVYSA